MSSIANFEVLIGRIKEGDVNAFKEFFLFFQPKILYFIYCYTHNKSAAEDITQDVFLEFWKVRQGLNNSLSPKSLLYKIARNRSINYIKRNHKTEKITDDDDSSFQLKEYYGIEQKIDYDIMIDDITKAINKLPPRCRSVFVLSRFNELSYFEIAETMDISLQTVKNHMSNALNILRQELSEYLR